MEKHSKKEKIRKEKDMAVNYEKTTTTKNFGGGAEEIVVKKLVTEDPELVVVTPADTRTTWDGMKRYELKRGVQIAVPRSLRNILARGKAILELTAEDVNPNER